ncbi:MAG: hypothetical protein KGL96_10690, partial [Hyphomicrobiales bacterium]|nr:hypothetical protein [Hyphomicrobiales bacterium]
FQQSAALYDPERDRESAFRFGQDIGVAAKAYLGWSLDQRGDADRARSVIDDMMALALRTGHAATIAYAHYHYAAFEVVRLNVQGARTHAEACLALAREHGMPYWQLACAAIGGWAVLRLDGAAKGLPILREALAAGRQRQIHVGFDTFLPYAALAEAELGQTDQALETIAAAIAGLDGGHFYDAEVHRIRGEILLKCDPLNTESAEESFLTAIAVAGQQGARRFTLRAALALAKLYQSTGRAADAYAALAPALAGFAPTPEFPEIEQAQTLLAALAESDAVKSAATARQRRLELQTGMAQALLQARGQHSAETQEAFSRARELASGIEDPLQRFSSYYGLWAGGYTRSEKRTMTEAAEALLRETDSRPESGEAGVAARINAITCWMVGDAAIAREHLEKDLSLYRPERDRDLAHRFAQDQGVATKIYLSLVVWVLGEPDRARGVINEALVLASETGHVPTIVYANFHAAVLEMIRRDPAAAKRHVEASFALAREHGLKLWTMLAPVVIAWSNACLELDSAEREEMRRRLAECHTQGLAVALLDQILRVFLGERLAHASHVEEGLAVVDAAIAEVERSGIRWFEAEAHRVRGEILLKRDPTNTAPAEEAFLTAIAIAQQQKARSFELRAALSLAKLYQSTGRAADAHAVLTPALEGFAPTPEFPEIEQAQMLLAAVSA